MPNQTHKNLNIIFSSAKIDIAHHIKTAHPLSLIGSGHHHSDMYQLNYLIKGKSKVKIGKNFFRVNEGDLVYVPPRVWHESFTDGESDEFEFLQMKFSLPEKVALGIPSIISIKSKVEFLNVFSAIINEFNMSKVYKEELLRCNLANLFLIIFRNLAGKTRKNKDYPIDEDLDAKINKAIEFIKNNYYNKITLQDISNAINVSPSYLSHNFKKFIGDSPVEYLLGYRLDQALWIMSNAKYNLDVVAEKTGFSDIYYFSRAFKKKYGLPPKRYYRSIVNSNTR